MMSRMITYVNQHSVVFFRDIKCVHEWFTDDELVKIFNGGYKLYKYTFAVDFDPNKILFGRLQCAVDHEYMLLDSTIKEEMNILTICDMPLYEKFMIHINPKRYDSYINVMGE